MQLSPSEIFYSQKSIKIYFDSKSSHAGHKLGATLDDICEGRCSINQLPIITVVKRGEKWVTADNRRLWVFKELQLLGKCDSIPVQVGDCIPSGKLSTENGGVSIIIRGWPGGEWYQKHDNKDHYSIVPNPPKFADHDSDDSWRDSDDNSNNSDDDDHFW